MYCKVAKISNEEGTFTFVVKQNKLFVGMCPKGMNPREYTIWHRDRSPVKSVDEVWRSIGCWMTDTSVAELRSALNK